MILFSGHRGPVSPPDFTCVTPGKDFLAAVTVSVERTWPDAAVALDMPTATSGWITSTNDWQEIELDSVDTSVLDSPNLALRFDAGLPRSCRFAARSSLALRMAARRWKGAEE